MIKIGDKLYSYYLGKVEIYTVLNNRYRCPGATVDTLIVRNDATGRRACVSMDMYAREIRPMYAMVRTNIQESIKHSLNKIKEYAELIAELENEDKKLEQLFNNNQLP